MIQKIKKFFSTLGYLVAFFLYPIISLHWYRHCSKENDPDQAKFVLFGTLGTVGIIGFIILIFLPSIQKLFVALPAMALYFFGMQRQTDFIFKKRAAREDEKRKSQEEERKKKEKEKIKASVIPTVSTWCLPADLTEDRLLELHQGIVKVMASFPETWITDESDILNLFPRDLMEYGLGSEIKVVIEDLPPCEFEVLARIAKAVGTFVKTMFPAARVSCRARQIYNCKAAYWSSQLFGQPETED